jgi:hypothetical protein
MVDTRNLCFSSIVITNESELYEEGPNTPRNSMKYCQPAGTIINREIREKC